jgi:hypothetical protein
LIGLPARHLTRLLASHVCSPPSGSPPWALVSPFSFYRAALGYPAQRDGRLGRFESRFRTAALARASHRLAVETAAGAWSDAAHADEPA